MIESHVSEENKSIQFEKSGEQCKSPPSLSSTIREDAKSNQESQIIPGPFLSPH